MNNDLSIPGSGDIQAHLPRLVTQQPKTEREATVLQKWSAQHKIEKHAGHGILAPLVALIKTIAGAVLVLVALIPITIAKTYSALSEKFTIYLQPDSPLAAIRKMKKQEETDKLETMKKVIDDFPKISKASPADGAKKLTEHLHTRLQDKGLAKNRAARLILRELSKQDAFDPVWSKALNDPKVVDQIKLPNDLGALFTTIKKNYPQLNLKDLSALDFTRINQKIKKRTVNPQRLEKEVRIYERSLKDLLAIIKHSELGDNPAPDNQELIAALRKALTNPVYQSLKEDLNDESVQFLHRLASDIWNKAPSMDAYRSVGESIAREMSVKDGIELDGSALAKQLSDSHEKMSELHYTDHGLNKLSYALTHPAQALGSMASEGGLARSVAGTVGQDVYDSHGKLSNNPSLQGTTSLQLENGKTAEVRNCYGGSPTIGDHKISPEFKAAIQAAENNQMLSPKLRDKNIPTMVVYNNLQDLHKKHGEGPRSRTIMLLNKKYPLSFRGTTFSKDSELYLMKKGTVWNGSPSEFGKTMRAQLDRSFNPQEVGHGFYFHGSREKWAPVFDAVFANANAHFEELKEKQPKLWKDLSAKDLQGAYQEYVYSLLNSAIEIEAVKDLLERGIDSPTVMVISACKENIDRGGMENTKYLYNRLGETEQEDRLPLIMGAMHSRALSARDRIILRHRTPQILNYMKTTSPDAFRDNQMKLFASLGYPILESEFRPHLKNYQQTQESERETKTDIPPTQGHAAAAA